MIRFYRPLKDIKAITFDLDDTLYDNHPVMQKTEQSVLAFMHEHYPELAEMQVDDFRRLRAEVREREPEIYHNVTQWRWRSIEWLLLQHGYTPDKAEYGATKAMEQFSLWRSRVTVPESTHQTLKVLAQRFQLAAITNGNANPHRFGLAGYFKFILRAGVDGRAKPYSDMYVEAGKRFNLLPSQILHVGDHLSTDVAGAVDSGLQSCWINDLDRNLMTDPDARILPHIEISRLESLQALL